MNNKKLFNETVPDNMKLYSGTLTIIHKCKVDKVNSKGGWFCLELGVVATPRAERSMAVVVNDGLLSIYFYIFQLSLALHLKLDSLEIKHS